MRGNGSGDRGPAATATADAAASGTAMSVVESLVAGPVETRWLSPGRRACRGGGDVDARRTRGNRGHGRPLARRRRRAGGRGAEFSQSRRSRLDGRRGSVTRQGGGGARPARRPGGAEVEPSDGLQRRVRSGGHGAARMPRCGIRGGPGSPPGTRGRPRRRRGGGERRFGRLSDRGSEPSRPLHPAAGGDDASTARRPRLATDGASTRLRDKGSATGRPGDRCPEQRPPAATARRRGGEGARGAASARRSPSAKPSGPRGRRSAAARR